MEVLAAILTIIYIAVFAIVISALATGAIVVICFVIGCLWCFIGWIKDHEMEDD